MNRPTFDGGSIEALARAERLNWFIRDNLVASVLKQAGNDRQKAISLLERAIAELTLREITRLQ